jgi:hypothetical protein
MGGDGPEKQKASAQEVEQATNAAARWNERIDDGYLALEGEAIADARTDHSGVIGARSSADIAQQEAAGLRQAVSAGGSNRDVAELGNTVASAESTRKVDVAQQAQTLKDSRMLEVAKVGQDVAATTASGLRKSAILGSSRASNEVQNKVLTDNAKFNAKLSAASGMANGLALRNEGFRLNTEGMQRTNETGLRGASLGLQGKDLTEHLAKKGNNVGYSQLAMGSI